MFKDWGKGIEPPEHITREQVQEMIDASMAKHNRRASLISVALGSIALVAYADGLLRIVERFQ
ncbi:hypothetical protein SBM1_00019 [Synechococcus phage S-BM1]|nr:hypothetical protein SBM1_00019 [Synechococcus phage S-BM1]